MLTVVSFCIVDFFWTRVAGVLLGEQTLGCLLRAEDLQADLRNLPTYVR